MTLLLDPKAREAVIHGPPRKLMEGAAQTVMENIARRVAEAPDGLIRSFQADGTLREETFAELWRRSGEIAARLRSLGVGPGSQRSCCCATSSTSFPRFWASLRVGATPIPFTGVVHAATMKNSRILVARLERPGAHRRCAHARPRPAGGFAARCADAPPFVALGEGDKANIRAGSRRRARHFLFAPDLGLDRDCEAGDARPPGDFASQFFAKLFGRLAERHTS